MTPQTPSRQSDAAAPRWHLADWLGDAELPIFEVLDTRSAQGRLDRRAKTVTVADLVLAHGHACDGLLRGVWAMRALADFAFGVEPIDRSDLLVVSKNSPCLGDVAAYLSGGRARFATHRLDDTLGVGFVLRRLSTGEIWEVREEPGFFPDTIVAWESALVEPGHDANELRELLAVHELAQWEWVRDVLLPSAPSEHYRTRALDDVELPSALHVARRTDVVNRSVPAPRALNDVDDVIGAPVTEPGTPWRTWRDRYEAGPGRP